jgi:hypothetical protein
LLRGVHHALGVFVSVFLRELRAHLTNLETVGRGWFAIGALREALTNFDERRMLIALSTGDEPRLA